MARSFVPRVSLLLGLGGIAAAGCGGVETQGLFGGDGGGATTSTGSTMTTSTSTGTGGAGVCGDGAKNTGEACDGMDFGGQSCVDFGFVKPEGLTCSADCKTIDSSACASACNNGKREPSEPCDGTDFGTQTCKDFGYQSPAGLVCDNCNIVPTNCKAVCGNNSVEPGEECDDGNTKNGDGCSSTCKNEVPQMGTTCANAIPVSATPGSQTVVGTTAGGGMHTGAGCMMSDAPDRLYAITVAANGFLTVSLTRAGTAFDSVLYISQNCSDGNANQDLLCADSYDLSNPQSVLTGGEVVSLRVQQGQTYYVFVDGYVPADSGAFTMIVNLATGTECGDPVPIRLEPGSPMTVLGSNTNTVPTTQGTCGGGPGGQVVYRIVRPDAATTGVDTDANTTTFNSALYARTTCNNPMSELACSNQQNNATESITFDQMPDVPVFVFVDGSQSGGGSAFGEFGLILSP